MKIEDFHQRVWSGLHELQRQAHDIEHAKIVVHPKTRAMLVVESGRFEWFRSPLDGVDHYRGLILETDERLAEEDIRIRYEVEA